jgi:hypothetical protein
MRCRGGDLVRDVSEELALVGIGALQARGHVIKRVSSWLRSSGPEVPIRAL